MNPRLLALVIAGCCAPLAAGASGDAAQIRPMGPACGLSPHDWCTAPNGDRRGVHKDETSCRADARCQGMQYRGESVVACMPDGKGFWSNCPAVGCVSRTGKNGSHESLSK